MAEQADSEEAEMRVKLNLNVALGTYVRNYRDEKQGGRSAVKRFFFFRVILSSRTPIAVITMLLFVVDWCC